MADKVIPDTSLRSVIGDVPRRWVEARVGEWAPEVHLDPSSSVLIGAVPVVNLWSTSVNLATGASVTSGWFDVSSRADIYVMRKTSTSGTYGFEVDWSLDGVTADIVEALTVGNNVSVAKQVMSRFARFRARNTDAVNSILNHLTTVNTR